MDVFEICDINFKLNENFKRKQKEIHEEGSKRLFLNAVEKAIRTTMIGSLARMEEAFGYYWGFQIPPHDCTESQLDIRDKWMEIRTKILNNGNEQIRKIKEDAENYTVSWDASEKKVPLQGK